MWASFCPSIRTTFSQTNCCKFNQRKSSRSSLRAQISRSHLLRNVDIKRAQVCIGAQSVRSKGAQSDVRTSMVGDYVKICFFLLKSDDVRLRFAALVRGIGTHYRCVLAWWGLLGFEPASAIDTHSACLGLIGLACSELFRLERTQQAEF